ncbi:hypothetical protein ACJEIK_26225 [Mycobacterium sp. SMC-16]|uniref:hypothetical protein n=1 Tax=Mycobacterium sp. SMC-16 TaxID=3385967 RepID=UPI00390CC098
MPTAVRKGWWSRNTLPWIVRATPVGIASAEAFGLAVVTLLGARITPAGIPSGEAVGAPVVVGPVTLAPAGIASGEAFGTAVVTGGAVSIVPAGIASTELFGAATVTRGPVTATPTGIPSDEVFGAVSVGRAIAPAGIASAEAIGLAKIVCTVSPAGIASTEAVGVPNIGRGPVTVTPAGIASLEAFGAAKVTFGPVTASGIASGEAFGTPAVSAGISVTNVLSGNAFDTNFWGQNWNSGVYLSSGKVYPNRVGGYFGYGKYYSGITCKTQFSANGAFVSAKASTAANDDRGTLLCVGIDSPTAMTKVISLAVRPSQGANTVEINKGTGAGVLANANAPATPAANDIWWFGWKKVGSDYVYTGYQNGAVAITWTDTGGATFGVPGRYVGIGSCLIQSNFNNFQDQNGWIGTVTCGDNT